MTNIVSLNNIKIYAYHGVLSEENLIGSYYNINISLHTNFIKACKTDDLNYTINYSLVNDIIHREMAIKSKLLENVSYRIVKCIFNEIDNINHINIKLSKLNPPVIGDVYSSTVELDTDKESI